ncbi:MAG TPA: TonB-dependent receptor [Candidatus Angelobacter sp.]|nr:TonB-dependent receptor [Candidatus Angelobacter sp.]
MKWRLAVVSVMVSLAAHAADVRGKVVSLTRSEPLRQVQVTVLELRRSAVTADDGTFALHSIPAGKYTLRASAVGFRLVTTAFQVAGDNDNKEFSITMAPDNFRRVDEIEVKGDIFQVENPAIPGQMVLNASELQQTGTVLANDPFRAVQAMPGVSATQNNDLLDEFSLLGAPFSSIGVYFDDVLVRSPFHTLPDFTNGASLSVLSSESVDEVNLMPVAYPVSFADGIGGALQMRTREGSRTRPLVTFAPGMGDSELTVEGELGSAKKGSWLVSGRKSYLGYLIRQSGIKPASDIELEDGNVKLSYDLDPKNNVSLYALSGHTDVSTIGGEVGPNFLGSGDSQFDLARAGWKYVPTPHLLVETHAAFMDESFHQRNSFSQPLSSENYGEWIAGTRSTWNWLPNHVLETGYTARRIRDGGNDFFFDNTTGALSFFGAFGATALRQTAFAQQSSSFLHQRLHLMAGLRLDRLEQVDANELSPQVSAGFQAASRTQLQFGFGRYLQYPELDQIDRECGRPGTPADPALPAFMLTRSDHFTAAIEQRVGENTRVRLQGFERDDHQEFGSRSFDGNSCSAIRSDAMLQQQLADSVLRTRARGFQIVIQRRSANRLSGWVGYTYDDAIQKAITTSFVSVLAAPTEGDQKHTANAFANYRLTPTVNLSAKFLYGSGFPFLQNQVTLTAGNTLVASIIPIRFPAYQRLDIRMDKAWTFEHWKMTLHVEGLNMTNHDNPQVIGSVFDPATGLLRPEFGKGLPILPTAGLVFEF